MPEGEGVEESFSSVQEEAQGLEKALAAIEKELESTWKTRSTAKEVEDRRGLLGQAREALASAVKQRQEAEAAAAEKEGVEESAKKQKARRLARLTAEAEEEAALEEVSGVVQDLNRQLAEEARKASVVDADPLEVGYKLAENFFRSSVPRFLTEAPGQELIENKEFADVFASGLNLLTIAAQAQVRELREEKSELKLNLEAVTAARDQVAKRLEDQLEKEAARSDEPPAHWNEAIDTFTREVAALKAENTRLLAEVDQLHQQLQVQGGGGEAEEGVPEDRSAVLRAELREVTQELEALKQSKGESISQEDYKLTPPVKGDGCWKRPRRLLSEYTDSLIEGTAYVNSVSLWRRDCPSDSVTRSGELLDTYPTLKNTSCESSLFEEIEYSLPVLVGLQDVLRTVDTGGSIRPRSSGHELVDDCYNLIEGRVSYILQLAEANQNDIMRRAQASSGAVSKQLATKTAAEVRADFNYAKCHAQQSVILPESEGERASREERADIYQKEFTKQLVREQTKYEVQQIVSAQQQASGRRAWRASRGGRAAGATRGGRGGNPRGAPQAGAQGGGAAASTTR